LFAGDSGEGSTDERHLLHGKAMDAWSNVGVLGRKTV